MADHLASRHPTKATAVSTRTSTRGSRPAGRSAGLVFDEAWQRTCRECNTVASCTPNLTAGWHCPGVCHGRCPCKPLVFGLHTTAVNLLHLRLPLHNARLIFTGDLGAWRHGSSMHGRSPWHTRKWRLVSATRPISRSTKPSVYRSPSTPMTLATATARHWKD